MNTSYFKSRKINYTDKLRELLKELPPCVSLYFRASESTNSILTRYSYAVDLRKFFEFCVLELPCFKGKEVADISAEELSLILPQDIEQYLSYVSLYKDGNLERENNECAKARKLSSIRSLFKYLNKRGYIPSNPAALVDSPKLHEKNIVRLEPDEVANLLDCADGGDGLTERQQQYHKIINVRDLAILSLFLGTGIRISELVGIDRDDINFDDNSFLVTRKGGNREKLSFSYEVSSALLEYKLQRESIIPVSGHEDAFFLSMQRKRITTRAVENLVEKYAKIVSPLKPITPHKLRSTYGTMLYQESGDIYLVADVLGHKDVNTTRKHYAAQSEERRRNAANYIHLREDVIDSENNDKNS